MNIANLRIGTRLGLGFGLVLVLLTGVAGLARKFHANREKGVGEIA